MARKSVDDLLVPIGDLRPYGRNPRRGALSAIKESLDRNGQYRPVVANRRTGEVLAGNHTLLAARELGWERLAVTYVDVDDEQAKRILLVDNRTNDLAGYDSQLLADLLEELPQLEGSGYDQAALDELLDELGPEPLDEEELAELPAAPKTKAGDLFALGRHRLLCADACPPRALAQVMEGKPAQLLWTGPPSGVSYTGKTAQALTIENDLADGLDRFLEQAFGTIDVALEPGARIYVAHPAGDLSRLFANAFVGAGWRLRQTLVWVKDAMVLGRSDYHYKHEPILYGHKAGPGRIARGAKGWYGDNAQVSVLEVERPRQSQEHPTMKPPALIEIALRNSTRRGEVVLDPFAGSGSTMVAAERTSRSARLIEID